MNQINELIYYSPVDGKVLSEQEARNINSPHHGKFRIVNSRKAIIENGYVINYQDLLYKPLSQIENDKKTEVLNQSYKEIKTMLGEDIQKEDPYAIIVEYEDDKIEKMYRKSKMERQIEQARLREKRNINKEHKIAAKKRFQRARNIVIGSFLAGAITATAVFGVPAVKETMTANDTQLAMTEVLNPEMPTQDLVNKHTHRTDDRKNFFYDNISIAKDIMTLDPLLFDAELYAVYLHMGPYADGNIDEVVRYATGYDSLGDYVISKGFIDENGNADMNAYNSFGKNELTNKNQYARNYAEQSKGGK